MAEELAERLRALQTRRQNAYAAAAMTRISGVLVDISSRPIRFSVNLGKDKLLQVQKELGQGTFGTVYGGVLDEKPVVVKIFRFESTHAGSNEMLEFVHRVHVFLREATIHYLISKYHKKLCETAVACAQPKMFMTPSLDGVLVFDWHASVSLGEWMATKNASAQTKRDLIISLLQNLLAFHEAGFAHLDLKPENVLVVYGTRRAELVLIDLGFACANPVGPDYREQAAATATTAMSFVRSLMEKTGLDAALIDLRLALLKAANVNADVLLDCSAEGTPFYVNRKISLPGSLESGFRQDLYAAAVIIVELVVGHRIFSKTRGEEYVIDYAYEQAAALRTIHPSLASSVFHFLRSENITDPLSSLRDALDKLQSR